MAGMAATTPSFHQRTYAETGVNYLRGSKVGSAAGYISVAGTILGLPHGKRSKSCANPRIRFDAVSEQGARYREMPYCYASMDKKPLVPYDPNAYRSRLAIDDAPVPYKNASTIEFNGGIGMCHKKRFTTTHQTQFTGEPCDPRSNQGILSESTKFRRTQQSK